MAIDYSDHSEVLKLIAKDQEAESDNRERVRECIRFVNEKDGQWEQDISSQLGDRPQYTFDLVGTLKDQIVNEMDQADFDIRIRPAGGDASKDIAATYDGMIRNIENLSDAQRVYMAGADDVVTGGLGGWEITQDWADVDSFDQDLFIKPISDFCNRVWFDSSAELPDMSDAGRVTVYTDMSPDDYKQEFPEGKAESLTVKGKNEVYHSSKEVVTVGRILWKKLVTKQLVLMTNGAVYERDDEFEKIIDELAAAGIEIKRERSRMSNVVCSRLFDNGGWLKDEKETVFQLLPVVPAFGHFKIIDGNVHYKGFVEPLMDTQRVFNYVKSREVETAALSPRSAYWMTEAMAAGHESELATMNTDSDPVRFFNPDPEMQGVVPQMSQSAAVDQGMMMLSGTMAQQIQASAGLFGINQGNMNGNMSGVAIQSLQNKGDNGTAHWFSAMETAITYTAKVLINAIPKVYDSERQVRVLGEDGTDEMITLNERVFDQQSESIVELNNLSMGVYDAVCDVGPGFKNRQQESIKAFQELAGLIPGLAESTADIQLRNIPTPGMDLAAARIRKQLLANGVIPEDQMTEEEIQQMQMLQQQPKELTPDEKIAAAEEARVQAETADVISKTEERTQKGQLAELTLMLKQQDQQRQAQNDEVSAMINGMKMAIESLNTNADTALKLKDLSGATSVMSDGLAVAMENQIDLVTEQQEVIDEELDQFVTGLSTDEIIRMLANGGV